MIIIFNQEDYAMLKSKLSYGVPETIADMYAKYHMEHLKRIWVIQNYQLSIQVFSLEFLSIFEIEEEDYESNLGNALYLKNIMIENCEHETEIMIKDNEFIFQHYKELFKDYEKQLAIYLKENEEVKAKHNKLLKILNINDE